MCVCRCLFVCFNGFLNKCILFLFKNIYIVVNFPHSHPRFMETNPMSMFILKALHLTTEFQEVKISGKKAKKQAISLKS